MKRLARIRKCNLNKTHLEGDFCHAYFVFRARVVPRSVSISLDAIF